MKNLVKGTLFAATVLVFAACSKEQGCINKLDGEWDVKGKAYKVSDGTEDTTGASAAANDVVTFTFEKYKEKDGSGVMKYKYMDGSTTVLDQTGTYTMGTDCETFNNSLPGLPLTYTIKEISSSKVVLEQTTSTYRYELTLTAK